MTTAVRNRTQLLLLAALFFGPLLAAFGLYFVVPQWAPQSRVNYGELVNPARPLPEVELRDAQGERLEQTPMQGLWDYVYLGQADCDARYEEKLFEIRQVHTLLNDKRERVRRVYVAPDVAAAARAQAQLEKMHPDMLIVVDDGTLAGFFGGSDPQVDPQALYLIDPLGNWLMTYPQSAEYKGILKDIKRLLRISQIG
jgi:cytochrome oxidase Cu insertion factor (SCO1/SenC/PrrC family)